MRFPRHRCKFVERLIKCLRCAVNFLPVSQAQGFAKHLHVGDDLFAVRTAEFIVLVTKVLAGMPQKQAAVLDVARRKHELNRLPFGHSERRREIFYFWSGIQRCLYFRRRDKQVHCALSTSMNAS
jgi:hypothetical protein